MAEDPVAVEAELARLRAENARLLKLLKLSPQQAAPPAPGQSAFFEAPPGIVHRHCPQEAKVAFFGTLFAARTDVYAVRYDNQRTGKSGWIPAVRGGWQKGVHHEDRSYLPLTPAVLAAHLLGQVHIGLYPLLDDDKCWWLAADFDGPEAMFDALMYVKAGRALQVPVALEVSRSGVGAHAWVFFTSPAAGPVDTLTAALWYRDGTFSRGTLRSLDPRLLFDGALRYENGNWSTYGEASRTSWRFPGAERPVPVGKAALPPVATVPRHLPLRRMEGMLAGEFNALKNGIPAAVIDAAPEGPDDEQRRQGKWTITVEAVSDGGRTIRGEVEGTDGYGKTAVIAVEAARRLVADGAKSGVLTPAQAFDPESFLGYLASHGGALAGV